VAPKTPLGDLRGRTCLVTGASDGIGKEIARGLAACGARVILVGRDAGRTAAARDDIAAGIPGAALEVQLVDLSRPPLIRTFAAGILAAHKNLHVLVNNAGGWAGERRVTPEGLEQTWATNVLGYFLTTRLLLERLCESAPARVVNVASNLAHGLALDDVGFERRRYDGIAAYAQSKQANRMFTWALARRLEGRGVTANALHPGGVHTGIFRKGGGLKGWAAQAFTSAMGKSPQAGADTAVWLAASPEVEGRSGLYFVDRRVQPCEFRNEAEEERLWALCEGQTAAGE
jgi:NAD(P)-dependent dehydrogenase (short-subunit alcohol dehydrogenase family)